MESVNKVEEIFFFFKFYIFLWQNDLQMTKKSQNQYKIKFSINDCLTDSTQHRPKSPDTGIYSLWVIDTRSFARLAISMHQSKENRNAYPMMPKTLDWSKKTRSTEAFKVQKSRFSSKCAFPCTKAYIQGRVERKPEKRTYCNQHFFKDGKKFSKFDEKGAN